MFLCYPDRQDGDCTMIRVTSEPQRQLVRAIMSGMLTIEDVHDFSTEEQAAVRQMGLASGTFDLLVETIGNDVQTQDVMNAFQGLILQSEFKARRIAIVRGGALVRMQSRRMTMLRPDCAVFEHVDDAADWLAEARPAEAQ